MRALLDHVWLSPRELPALADEVVEALVDRVSAMSALPERRRRAELRSEVETALRGALSRPEPENLDEADGEYGSLTRERARQELFAALTAGSPLSAEALASLAPLARRAAWQLPAAVRAVVLGSPGELQLATDALGDPLIGITDGRPCALLPDPDPEARSLLRRALPRGRAAAVGHVVPLGEARSSLRWARRLVDLAPEAQLLFVEDHLPALLLLQDESLVRALSARWLRPLDALKPAQSARLETTLLAWLEGGGAPEAAKTLKVHPQTVHYRLRQLEKLFGPVLRDPRSRFELEMTLHSRRLLAQVRDVQARISRRARTAAMSLKPMDVAREARVNGR
ncbi:PucR family transcriptional regulator [Streptomyces millisiae]|uniref:Helix-turn-helix domain-containing protein n=1 Tax=Streptomyces millisiae TaxID=3075542 RepID=A0ABU2LL08_9ACTN|nr:helix-turn-helix domain-containing protein [Streptomyces sp. DSM 44918]MDT0318270.1 helix-turn-helix domain-containing protein [Streptomyces sp. DSM 44918]